MTSIINESGINYVTFDNDKVKYQYLMISGHCNKSEPNTIVDPKYFVMSFAPVTFLSINDQPITNFNTDVKEPLKKIFIKAVTAFTTDDAVRKSYKENGLNVQFPDDGKNNKISPWAWTNTITDPQVPLFHDCQLVLRIKQVTVLKELLKNSKIKYTIIPKFEVFSSIKLISKSEAAPIPEEITDEDIENMATQPTEYVSILKRTHSSSSSSDNLEDMEEQDQKSKKKQKKN